VLDLCCGVAGPGRFITQELGCSYLGVDLSASAIEIARERAGGLPCRFEVARIPPIPRGPFDVVLLLETMLAFPEKETLVREVSTALSAGGRFAFTMEEGQPLTEAERARMPDADTVWLTPLPELLACLEESGLVVRWQDDHSRSHRALADSLIDAFAVDAANIATDIGHRALDELLAAHRLWSDWLGEGRLRKLAFVAQKTATPRTHARMFRRRAANALTSPMPPDIVLQASCASCRRADHAVSRDHGCGLRYARTSRTSWSLCVAGSTSVEGERSALVP
jgi:SAM-dependent methyltransferase